MPICPVNCQPRPSGIHTAGGYHSVAGAAGAVGSGIIGGVDQRTTYVVEKEITTRDEAAKACAAVLEVLRPALRFAAIDAYSDYDDQMPPDVAEAGRWLRERGSDRRSGDPGMAVEVPVSDDGWEVLCRYAPWSIHVELYGDGPSPIGTLHDCAYSISADLNPAEASALAGRLEGVSGLIPLKELRERRRRRAERRSGDGQDR